MDALDDGENAPAPKIAPAIQPLEEPWWLVIGERIATDRRLWLAAGVIAMLAIAAAFVPRGKEPGVALSAIKRHPERFEGRAVTVRGKVGEVFDVGQGYVFHLHQGRDTVVVFSPSRRPKTHDGVVVAGTVTTGYLDGAARVAVFENP